MHDHSKGIPGDIIKPEVTREIDNTFRVTPGMVFPRILKMIESGKNICLEGTWGFAMSLHSWFKARIYERFPAMDYSSSRKQITELRRLQSYVWVRITGGVVSLKKGPDNPWLPEFYPGLKEYLIRLSDFLGMNGAWQWYRNGAHYDMLNHPVHPFYGVYFPTRTEHLLLFDNWLKGKEGQFRTAYDIGTGCGVLSFIMNKRRIGNIIATDINPNAVFSVNCDVSRLRQSGTPVHINAEKADLFGDHSASAGDIVVCNPPWIPAAPEKILDYASYYPPGFFDRLFGEFKQKCSSGTTLVILFSDFANAAGISESHPVREALNENKNYFVPIEYEKSAVKQKSKGRNKSWINQVREKESIEIFVIRRA